VALINMIPAGATPAERTRLLAGDMADARADFVNGGLGGPRLGMYQRLSLLQCWDASLLCAWAAKGIECDEMNLAAAMFTVVTAQDYTRIFGDNVLNDPQRVVRTADEMRAMPGGCFVGFISNQAPYLLRHCMLHLTDGIGAGNKSDCVLTDAHTVGWERLDMTHFFGKDADHSTNATTTVVYAPVTGQHI
jgi:hypothetical protein